MSCLSSCWSRGGAALVADGTFGDGEGAKRTLAFARTCLLALYALVAVCFFSGLAALLLGRVEIVDHRTMYEQLEAPSVAICPWEPLGSMDAPPNATYTAYAIKVTASGQRRLKNVPTPCKYDRSCQCLDLSDVALEDSQNEHRGFTNTASDMVQNFRERVEIHTTLLDSSPTRTLKFGFYDSLDKRPSWFYARQWYYVVGQLRLDSWLVSEASALKHSLLGVLSGQGGKLDRRHFYTYTFSSTDDSMEVDGDGQRSTTLSYEFRTFFVQETISASRSLSLFTVVSLLILLVALSNILLVWETMFPIQYDGGVKRSAAPPLRWLSRWLFGSELADGHAAEGECEAGHARKYGSV